MTKQERNFYHVFSVGDSYSALLWKDNCLQKLFLPEKSEANLRATIVRTTDKPLEAMPQGKIADTKLQVCNYFAGKPYNFRGIKLDFSNCNEFCQMVYQQLLKIRPGTTTTYGNLAKALNKPGAARAIGRAVGTNPFPLIVPCHRVVKSDGKIGGFSSVEGIRQKIQMLELEGLEIQLNPTPSIKAPKTLNKEEINKGTDFICKVDPQFGEWIKQLPTFRLDETGISSVFQALLESIVYQQLTGKAASTIYRRILELVNANGTISPLDIIRVSDSELRAAGLSGPKILAIRDLAEKALAGLVPEINELRKLQNEEIIERLIQIRGIGRWSVEMLLIFKLGRADILAADDYGLKKGWAIIRNEKALPSPAALEKEGKIWQPYRTIASWYLWRVAETKVLSN